MKVIKYQYYIDKDWNPDNENVWDIDYKPLIVKVEGTLRQLKNNSKFGGEVVSISDSMSSVFQKKQGEFIGGLWFGEFRFLNDDEWSRFIRKDKEPIKLQQIIEYTDRNKSTWFSLQIYDVMKKIDEEVEKWFQDTYYGTLPIEGWVYTRNCLMNLDYQFTQGVWLIELAESLDLELDECKRFFFNEYETYINEGHKSLVNNPKYNRKEDRLFTDEEIEERSKRSSEVGMRISNKMIKNMTATRKVFDNLKKCNTYPLTNMTRKKKNFKTRHLKSLISKYK